MRDKLSLNLCKPADIKFIIRLLGERSNIWTLIEVAGTASFLPYLQRKTVPGLEVWAYHRTLL